MVMRERPVSLDVRLSLSRLAEGYFTKQLNIYYIGQIHSRNDLM